MNLNNYILESNRPFLITGPCSAETEEQVFSIFQKLHEKNLCSLFRAGIWKPRTRPDSFEGIGKIGLDWVVNAGREFKIPTSVEVANAKHVELAINAGIDVLWIGARTTVNPFAVQEIVDALKGVQIPIMIKNPVNPDINLWIGAFERFLKDNHKDLTAIHRGFSVYQHPKYRNVPSWEIPISFKQNMPSIPIICDPSHISGKRDLLLEISQKAMDLNFDGLMIETHPEPINALSDSKQQITSIELADLISKLILRRKNISDINDQDLDDLRNKISSLDDQLFDLLATRMQISEEVGIFKDKNNITVLQEDHWKKNIANRLLKSEQYKLTPLFIQQIMDSIHQESIRHQLKVMNPDLKRKG